VNFESIANIVINEFGSGEKEYIPMPADLKAQYQLDTKANTSGLVDAGLDVAEFFEAWQGIKEYVKYLKTNQTY
jgi:nucleoside-diphosphate-sugar epimerase